MIEDSAYCYGQHIKMEYDVIAILWLIMQNFTSTNIGHQIDDIMLDRIRRVQAACLDFWLYFSFFYLVTRHLGSERVQYITIHPVAKHWLGYCLVLAINLETPYPTRKKTVVKTVSNSKYYYLWFISALNSCDCPPSS